MTIVSLIVALAAIIYAVVSERNFLEHIKRNHEETANLRKRFDALVEQNYDVTEEAVLEECSWMVCTFGNSKEFPLYEARAVKKTKYTPKKKK